MPITEYSQQDLDEARRALGDETPIYMVNLIRYRTEADCGGDLRFVPCSGRDAYQQRYVAVAAFNKTLEDETVSVVWLGGVAGVVVAPDGKSWGDIVIVQYEDFAALSRILGSPFYEEEAAPRRRAALEDWHFIATTKTVIPA